MDLSKFITTNAEEWYDNMLECTACTEEVAAGTLQDMLDWATEHAKTCVPKKWFAETTYNSATYQGYWRTDWTPLNDAERAVKEEQWAGYSLGNEIRFVPRVY